MRRLSAFGKGRLFGGLPVAGFVAAAAVVAGCGGRKDALGPVFLEMVEYDHYFFDDPESAADSPKVTPDAIKAEIERLAAPAWRVARANIITKGADAIPWLIANLDRPEPSHVSLRPVPGHTMPESRETWTLGQVVHSVLLDLIGNYGSLEGCALPPCEKAAWEAWWRANRKKIRIYTIEGTIPAHVRKQKKEQEAAAEKRYPDLDAAVARTLEKRAVRERAREKALREREQELLEKRRQVEAR